jgi:hypothetical protein
MSGWCRRRYLSDHSIRQVLSPLPGAEQAGTDKQEKEVIALNAA